MNEITVQDPHNEKLVDEKINKLRFLILEEKKQKEQEAEMENQSKKGLKRKGLKFNQKGNFNGPKFTHDFQGKMIKIRKSKLAPLNIKECKYFYIVFKFTKVLQNSLISQRSDILKLF